MTERDEATGLEHTWWRKYDNTAGRWTSPDPYNGSFDQDDPQSTNRYVYVSNDPMNAIDPSGLDEISPAVTLAQGLLRHPPCRNLFPKNVNPAKFLGNLYANNMIRAVAQVPKQEVNPRTKQITDTKKSRPFNGVVAETQFITTPRGRFLGGIFLNSNPKVGFFLQEGDYQITPIAGSISIGVLDYRGLVLLHELLHATNARLDRRYGSRKDHSNYFDSAILVYCFITNPYNQKEIDDGPTDFIRDPGALNLRQPFPYPRSIGSNWNPFDLLLLYFNSLKNGQGRITKITYEPI